MKYTKEDILQYLKDKYNFQAVFDPEVDPGFTIEESTSIADWRCYCDLLPPTELARYYFEFFNLNSDFLEFEHLLMDQKRTTIGDFCAYLSQHAFREEIKELSVLGTPCKTASIFKHLKKRLGHRGVQTKDLRPSTSIPHFFNKHGVELVEEVVKIAPGTIKSFEYEENEVEKIGSTILSIGILVFIPIMIISGFHWALLIPFVVGLLIVYAGSKYEPQRLSIGGFADFRQLVEAMSLRLD